MNTRSWCASPYHKGPRWLLAMEFHTHSRHRSGLQSYCRTCVRIAHRAENLSPHAKAYKNEYSRRVKEQERRANGVPRRNLVAPSFYPDKLVAYLDEHVEREGYLNGYPLSDTDTRWMRRLRDGTTKRVVSLRKADEIATRYDLQFWELVEAAGRYKIDRRTKRRIRVTQG